MQSRVHLWAYSRCQTNPIAQPCQLPAANQGGGRDAMKRHWENKLLPRKTLVRWTHINAQGRKKRTGGNEEELLLRLKGRFARRQHPARPEQQTQISYLQHSALASSQPEARGPARTFFNPTKVTQGAGRYQLPTTCCKQQTWNPKIAQPT